MFTMMLTPEENAKLINLVKEQPLLYANFNFSVEVYQQVEVLKFETWENISKAMNMESKFSLILKVLSFSMKPRR